MSGMVCKLTRLYYTSPRRTLAMASVAACAHRSRRLGRICRAHGEGSPPYKRFGCTTRFSVTRSRSNLASAQNQPCHFGPHLELNEEDNARSVASPCSESCHGIITEQHSQSREKIRGARGTQAFAAHGMIDDPRNHGRTEHPAVVREVHPAERTSHACGMYTSLLTT